MSMRHEMELTMRDMVQRLWEEVVGDDGRFARIESDQRATKNILTGNGHPEEGLSWKVQALLTAASRAASDAAAAKVSAEEAKRLAAEARAAATKAAQLVEHRAAGGSRFSWKRLGFEISKGVGVAVGSAFILTMIGVFVLGLRIYFAAGAP